QLYGVDAATDWEADSTLFNGFMRGPLFQLPAGALDAVIGAEYEKSGLERGMDANRYAHAFFTELRAPLMARRDGGALLAVSGALGRRQRFRQRNDLAGWTRVPASRFVAAASHVRHGIQAADAVRSRAAAHQQPAAGHGSAAQSRACRHPVDRGRQSESRSDD